MCTSVIALCSLCCRAGSTFAHRRDLTSFGISDDYIHLEQLQLVLQREKEAKSSVSSALHIVCSGTAVECSVCVERTCLKLFIARPCQLHTFS